MKKALWLTAFLVLISSVTVVTSTYADSEIKGSLPSPLFYTPLNHGMDH